MSWISLPHFESNSWPGVKSALLDVATDSSSYSKQYSSIFPNYDLPDDDISLLEFLAARALEIEELFPSNSSLMSLHTGFTGEVILSQRKILCLLSNAFFDTFPPCSFDGQHFSFKGWIYKRECIACFMIYVRECHSRMEKSRHWTGTMVSVSRRATTFTPDVFADCTRDLSYVSVASCPESAIEGSVDCFHADFANAHVGGSVLYGSFAQEEIRFLIAPECLLSVLLCERMEDTESILIRGAEQFSAYSGFGSSFHCTGPYLGPRTAQDQAGFLSTFVVAMDASPHIDDADSQYDAVEWHREIVKVCVHACVCVTALLAMAMEYGVVIVVLLQCVAALDVWPCEQLEMTARRIGHVFYRAFATGNWGCGTFGGDPQFKFLLQWLAASFVGRDLVYFPFGDERMDELGAITSAISQRQTRRDKRLMVAMEVGERDEGLVVYRYAIALCTNG